MRRIPILMAAALLLASAGRLPAQTLDGRAAESLYNKVKTVTAPYHLPNQIAVLHINQDGTFRPYADDRLQRWFGSHLSLYRDEQMPKGVLTHEQAVGMVHLGELLQVAHFSLVNSADPAMQQIAVSTSKQLAAILAPTQLPGVSDTFTKIAAGPNGSGAQIAACDEAMRKVDAYVANNYGHDGLWYFALGTAATGLHAVAEGDDSFHAPEYRDLLHEMLSHQPVLEPPTGTEHDIQALFDIGWPEDQSQDVARAAQKILTHFWIDKEV